MSAGYIVSLFLVCIVIGMAVAALLEMFSHH